MAKAEAPAVVRSEGQRLLLAVRGTLAAIAAEVGARSKVTVRDWKLGTKTPSDAARARLATAFGIPVHSWSLRPGALQQVRAAGEVPMPPLPPSTSSAVEAPSNGHTPSSLEHCLALLAVIQRDRDQAGLMPSERVKLAGAEAQILALRAKLEQAAEFAESRYVTQHPSWLRLRRTIVEALDAHPEAARAVADAIAAIETKGP